MLYDTRSAYLSQAACSGKYSKGLFMRLRVLVYLVLPLCACSSHGPARAGISVEDMVRSLDDQARTAALNRDIPALERLWSEDLTVNAPNNTVVVGRRAVL